MFTVSMMSYKLNFSHDKINTFPILYLFVGGNLLLFVFYRFMNEFAGLPSLLPCYGDFLAMSASSCRDA